MFFSAFLSSSYAEMIQKCWRHRKPAMLSVPLSHVGLSLCLVQSSRSVLVSLLLVLEVEGKVWKEDSHSDRFHRRTLLALI